MIDNWIMMLNNKLKKIMSKQTEHDGRFDALDSDVGKFTDDMSNVSESIGTIDTHVLNVNNSVSSAISKIDSTQSTVNTISTNVQSLMNSGNSVIKNVYFLFFDAFDQRSIGADGLVSGTFSTVNLNKSVFLVNNAALKTRTSTSVTLKAVKTGSYTSNDRTYYSYAASSCQIIEFY